MVKIRITGLPDEVERFLDKFRKHFFILNETKPCKNSNSKFVRKYVDVQEDNKNE
jgi:hypothetical protein